MQRSYIPYAGLAAAVCVAFGASLTSSFHFDDFALLVDPYVTAPDGWWQVWRPEQTRPLTYFTFWFNYALGGEHPFGYHLLSLLIHLASTLLLYDCLGRLLPGRAGLIAAALFAVHPIQTEPVVYIYARGTLLMALFCGLSLRSWLDGRPWRAVIWFGLALLAKEECVAFPVFLLLLNLSMSRGRKELRPIAVMLALAGAAGLRIVAVLSRLPDSGAGPGSAVSALDYLATQGVVILRYFRLLVVPYGFTVDPEIELTSGAVAALAWAALVVSAVLATRRFGRVREGFWYLSGLVLLLPSSSVFPINDLAADRRVYLPLMAFAAAAGLLLRRTNPKFLAAVGVLLVAVTITRVQVWQTEESLWTEAVERSPGKIRPRLRLARVTADPDRALRILTEAQTIAPGDPRLASEKGSRYLAQGRPDQALAEFGKALALEPGNALHYNNRGVALSALGQTDAARRDFHRALELQPCLFDAYLNLNALGDRVEIPARCRFTPKQRTLLGLPD